MIRRDRNVRQTYRIAKKVRIKRPKKRSTGENDGKR